jgi:hypothetical protein
MSAPTKPPRCDVPGHGPMTKKKPGTPEQAFCGVGFECERCEATQRPGRKSIYYLSDALKAQLAEQRASLAQGRLL